MADVSAIFGILLFIGLAFPGWLMAYWLLFPATVERARVRLERTPWRCFWLGGVLMAVFTTPLVVLFALPFGPAKLAGFVGVILILAVAGLGAAGLAAKMAHTLAHNTVGHNVANTLSPYAAFLRGAVALELAAALPLLGWFIFVPLAIVTAMGAAGFALLHWMPKPLVNAVTPDLPKLDESFSL